MKMLGRDFPIYSEYRWCSSEYEFNALKETDGEGWQLLGVFENERIERLCFLVGRNAVVTELFDK